MVEQQELVQVVTPCRCLESCWVQCDCSLCYRFGPIRGTLQSTFSIAFILPSWGVQGGLNRQNSV